MSDTDPEVPMDVDVVPNQDEDTVLTLLSLMWINPDDPQKIKRPESSLEKMLQSWFNKGEPKVDCSVKETLTDGRVVIKIKPAPAITGLQKLIKQTLTGKDGHSVTITAVSLTLLSAQVDTQVPEDASVNLPPSHSEPQTEQSGKQSKTGPAAGEENGTSSMSEPQTEQVKLDQQSNTAAAAEESLSCSVPVGLFWYVNHVYEEEMKRIEKKNGVQIVAEVKVRFELEQKDGSLDKAFNEFINLVQNSVVECCSSVIPLKSTAPDQWSDALKTIQKKKNKCLVTLTSEQMTVCGPRQSQDVIRKFLNADTQQKNTNASIEEYEREIEDTSLKIDMTTKDHLMHAGLTVEESYWKLMNSSYSEKVAKIKDKFNVELKESDVGQGKVNVKASYKKDEGNASMEIHALRGLLRLCQKIAASPVSLSQPHGASGSSGSLMTTNSVSQSERGSNETVLNTQSTNRKHNTDAPQGAGATAGEGEERCPICLDTFKNKKRLKCKHEFCEECLQQAKDATGPICPICRVVFGKIMGDQPDGKMSWIIIPSPLPGFTDCTTIVINYEIPSGIQTEKHPKPGKYFLGIYRNAYLPNNTEGNEVLQLLKKAFDQKLIFTIGTSRTTGREDQVTWNDIHHKTSMSGGPQSFGYPDRDYLSRVKEELKAKGIE